MININTNYNIGINRIVQYKKFPNGSFKKKKPENSIIVTGDIQLNMNFEEQKAEEKSKFTFSKRSISRLKQRLTWFVRQSKFLTIYSKKNKKRYSYKLAMITLTLASTQRETDKQNKNYLLNHFLTIMRRSHGLKNYIWRAEKQKNGNIHYHIIVDKYFHHSIIKSEWNHVLLKSGYIGEFEKKHKHKNPNSTDVHALKNIKNVQAYLLKYMSKDENTTDIEGRNWTCSHSITKYCKDMTLTQEDSLTDVIEYVIKNCPDDKKIIDKHFSIYMISIDELAKTCTQFRDLISKYINEMRYNLNNSVT